MADIPENRLENKEPAEGSRENANAPLDGSTSGTIGGGGAETGGPTPRPRAPETPRVKPEDAASGRRAPDPIAATNPNDPLKRGPGDTSPK